MKTEQITVRDSDPKEAKADSRCDEIRAIVTDQINRHVAMTDTHRAWLADDITTRVLAVIAPLSIARHHAEERAAVENVLLVLKAIEFRASIAASTVYHNPLPHFRNIVENAKAAIAALTALRTASQSPTERKT